MEACATWAVEALVSSEGAASANAWLERPGLLPTLAVQMQSCNMELLRAACFTYSKLAIQVRSFTVRLQSCNLGLFAGDLLCLQQAGHTGEASHHADAVLQHGAAAGHLLCLQQAGHTGEASSSLSDGCTQTSCCTCSKLARQGCCRPASPTLQSGRSGDGSAGLAATTAAGNAMRVEAAVGCLISCVFEVEAACSCWC